MNFLFRSAGFNSFFLTLDSNRIGALIYLWLNVKFSIHYYICIESIFWSKKKMVAVAVRLMMMMMTKMMPMPMSIWWMSVLNLTIFTLTNAVERRRKMTRILYIPIPIGVCLVSLFVHICVSMLWADSVYYYDGVTAVSMSMSMYICLYIYI